MNTATIYARISSDLKDKIIALAKSSGKQQGETLTALLNQGLLYEESQRELKETQGKLTEVQESARTLGTELERVKADLAMARREIDVAERAKGHLQRILNTEVGRCVFPDCGAPVNLYGFVYQQCPCGHSRRIELHDEYKKAPGVGDVIVTGLAIFGGVALAAELLGDKRTEGTS